MNRREAISAGLGGMAGAAAALGGVTGKDAYDDAHPLQFYGGYASALPPDPTHREATGARMVWAGSTHRKALALTFDDGPHPDWTPRVLAALKAADVPATFFLLGRNVAEHGAIHRHSLGDHELGNHTFTHPDLGRLDHDRVRDELARTSDAMAAAYGRRPTLFRPPYGHLGGAAMVAAASLGLTTVLWDAQFRESRFHDNPDGIVDDVISLIRPGSIVLGHDTGATERLIAIDRLPRVLSRLKDDGWTFHTVSQLLTMH